MPSPHKGGRRLGWGTHFVKRHDVRTNPTSLIEQQVRRARTRTRVSWAQGQRSATHQPSGTAVALAIQSQLINIPRSRQVHASNACHVDLDHLPTFTYRRIFLRAALAPGVTTRRDVHASHSATVQHHAVDTDFYAPQPARWPAQRCTLGASLVLLRPCCLLTRSGGTDLEYRNP